MLSVSSQETKYLVRCFHEYPLSLRMGDAWLRRGRAMCLTKSKYAAPSTSRLFDESQLIKAIPIHR